MTYEEIMELLNKIEGIEKLELSGEEVTKIPDGIGGLFNLEKLKLKLLYLHVL